MIIPQARLFPGRADNLSLDWFTFFHRFTIDQVICKWCRQTMTFTEYLVVLEMVVQVWFSGVSRISTAADDLPGRYCITAVHQDAALLHVRQ